MRNHATLRNLTLGTGLVAGLALAAVLTAPGSARAGDDWTVALTAGGLELAFADSGSLFLRANGRSHARAHHRPNAHADHHPGARDRSHGRAWGRELRKRGERERLVRKARRALRNGRYLRASRLLRRAGMDWRRPCRADRHAGRRRARMH